MKNTNLTIWTKQEELKYMKKELANAKRRHKRQQNKLDLELTSKHDMVEKYHEHGVNELRNLIDDFKSNKDAYEALTRIKIANKIALEAMSNANTKEIIQKSLSDTRCENEMLKEIVELEKEIVQLQKQEVA